MKRFSMLGLCLVAVSAMFAMAVSSASAAGGPLWYECGKAGKITLKYNSENSKKVKTPHEKSIYDGKYSGKSCGETELAPSPGAKDKSNPPKVVEPSYEGPEGKYELVPGVGKGKEFKGSGSGEIYLESFNPVLTLKIKCTSITDKGLAVMPDLQSKVVATYKGCEVLGNKCTSTGAKPGEIKTPPLAGELGYLNTAGKVVGALLTNEAEPGGPGGHPGAMAIHFNCTAINVTVTGAVINVLTGKTNTISKTTTSTYKGGKYLGEVESPFGKFEPVTNPPVFENEYLKLIKKEQVPNILESLACGPVVEENIHLECAPLAIPSAQNQTSVESGENIMIKA